MSERNLLGTVTYFLLSIIISLIGLLLLVIHVGSNNQSTVIASIGASLLAGGIASLGFGLLRYIDDSSGQKLQVEVDRRLARVEAQFTVLQTGVGQFGVEAMNAVRRTTKADERCVSDDKISDRLRQEHARFALRDRDLHIDVLGLKLFRFLEDQLNWLESSNHATSVRMLLQYPYSAVFQQICELEARSPRATREDIARTLDKLTGATIEQDSLTWANGNLRVQLRFYDKYQPVALFRVQDAIYVRPRVNTPLGASSRFYEVYEKLDSEKHYRVQSQHFERCWSEGHYTGEELIRLRRDLRGGS
jgi:hypothetical protein